VPAQPRLVAQATQPMPTTRRGMSAQCVFCRAYDRVIAGDTRQVFTAPSRWSKAQWKSVGLKALIIAGTIAVLDKPVKRYIDNHQTSTTNHVADTFEPFGRSYAADVMAGYLIAGGLAHRPRAQAIAVDGITSTIITSGLIVPALKEIAGRSRPRTNLGPHDFHPFSGSASFPSGHAAAAFTIAATIAQHHRALWVKGLAYGVASMVGYARMEKDAHYLSDVTASAMIGIGVARYVSRMDGQRRRRLAIAPWHDPNTQGLGLSVALTMR
jgi:hypothetical protein